MVLTFIAIAAIIFLFFVATNNANGMYASLLLSLAYLALWVYAIIKATTPKRLYWYLGTSCFLHIPMLLVGVQAPFASLYLMLFAPLLSMTQSVLFRWALAGISLLCAGKLVFLRIQARKNP